MYGTIFRLVWPFLQRLLAKRITDYLQKRREQRLQAQAIVVPLAQESDQVKRLEYSPALSRLATVDAVWFTLSGILLGSAISLILAQIFLREE
jgi:hypothetical protein